MTPFTVSDDLGFRRLSAQASWQRLRPVLFRWAAACLIAGVVLTIPFALLGATFGFVVALAGALPAMILGLGILGYFYGLFYRAVPSHWLFSDDGIRIRTLAYSFFVPRSRLALWTSAPMPAVPGALVVLIQEKERWFEARAQQHTLLVDGAAFESIAAWFHGQQLRRSEFPPAHPGAARPGIGDRVG